MISFFRRALSSWLVLGLLGLVMIAFIITGVNSPTGTGSIGGGDTLASVGDEEVTSTEVADQMNRQLSQARERQPELDMARFLQAGAYEEILRQLIQQKAMLAFGRDQGIAASKRMIDGEIASIPAFKNLAGQFDPDTFRNALAREKMSEQQLRDEIAAGLIQRQILLPVAG